MENCKSRLSKVVNAQRIILLVVVIFLFVGCASQRPVLYPNSQFNRVGESVSKQDIDACMRLAATHGAKTQPARNVAGRTAIIGTTGAAIGAASGAVTGNAARGAATGAAGGAAGGFMWGLFNVNKVDSLQKSFVEECLRLKGYRIIGWK